MSTIKLPYKRFVRQVSNGGACSKYAYLAMMRANAAALEAAPWAETKASSPQLTVNQLTRTDGTVNQDTGEYITVPSFTAYLNDVYDCFTQAGDAVSRMATMCGYAGIVAYRFTLPTVNPGAITEMALCIQRDRYLRSGVRVVASLSDSATPSDDWAVIRGTATGSIVSPSTASEGGGVESYGFLGQPGAGYLLAGRADGGTITFKATDFPALSGAASHTYLYVYLSPEDLAGSWEWYSETDPRAYYIEGSAMLVPTDTTFTFATAAVPPSEPRSFELVRGGVVPSFEATETLSPVLQVTVQKNGDPIDYNSIKQLAATVVGNGGAVLGTKVHSPLSSNTLQYAFIYGYGFRGTWPDIPGLVVYDIVNRQLLYSDTDVGISQSASQLLKDGVYGVYDILVAAHTLCPLLFQIGHTNPTPILDGTVCKIISSGDALDCFSFFVNDGVVTTSTSGVLYHYDTVRTDGFGSVSGAMGGNALTFSFSVMAKKTSSDGGTLWCTRSDYPSCAFVGDIMGIVPLEYDGSAETTVAGRVFVWGELTSIGGTSCSRCAIVSWINGGGGQRTVSVTVPEIDYDANWPEMGAKWSVQPQMSTTDGATRLAADLNSYLICGCADKVVRRWVTGVWYATAYDEEMVFGRELPQVGVIGNSTGYGGFFPATIATESTSIPITDAAAGLRALYGRFRAFGLTAVPNVTQQIGAAFAVSWKECQLKSSGVKIGSWQIAASALVVPFGCPSWKASQIEFDWTGWSGARTAGTKFHVWLARNAYTLSPQMLTGSDIWGNGSASGVEYVGEIDPTGAHTFATLALARPLAGGYATLIVTAYVGMDDVNPSESPALPHGASSLEVNMADGSVENGATAFMPDITLH